MVPVFRVLRLVGGKVTDLSASQAWSGLAADLGGGAVHVEALLEVLHARLGAIQHGDLTAWMDALASLPAATPGMHGDSEAPRLGEPVADPEALALQLMAFHPWRKGPLELGGVRIDTEWRSDWKWDRIAPHLELEGARVLDVGCGNGYFGWRMLSAGARCVVGIDPTVLFVVQWLVQRHFAGAQANYVLPLKDTDLPPAMGHFDVVMSMGVLYHRREPMDHLHRLRRCTADGGQLLMETLVVEGPVSLYPTGRYARMRNVHEIPTVERLCEQVRDAGFSDIEVLNLTRTTTEEQRSTAWMQFESLAECLDPHEPLRTIEGYPAPLRAVLSGRARP